MMNEERCPYCKSELYEVIDFDDDFFYDEDKINFYWQCKCNECNKIFRITRWYKLVDTVIETEGNVDE